MVCLEFDVSSVVKLYHSLPCNFTAKHPFRGHEESFLFFVVNGQKLFSQPLLAHIASIVVVLINDALSVPWKATMQQPGAVHGELDERNMSGHTLMTLVRKMVCLPTLPPRKFLLHPIAPNQVLVLHSLGEYDPRINLPWNP